MKAFLKLLLEPFSKGNEYQSLWWRMKVRWSHLPKWFKRIPCIFGHWWGPWEPIKYVSTGRERGCRCCGKGQADYSA